MGDLTKDFWRHEFACPCCGQCKMDPEFMLLFQDVRTHYGKEIHIPKGGGYRCPNYGGSETSAHREGKAGDLLIPREDIFYLVRLAITNRFTGIGVKNKDGEWQLHFDNADEIPGKRPRPWLWTY